MAKRSLFNKTIKTGRRKYNNLNKNDLDKTY